MSYQVLLLDNVDPSCAEVFQERGVETHIPGKLTDEELKQEIGKYDAVVLRSGTTITKDLLKYADRLKVIGRAGVGVDNIDISAATAKGILVMNTPDGNTISTAEHTCGMILALSRNIPQSVARVKSGGWDRKSFMGTEVHGKKLGIVGLGKIGSEVAHRMKAFGMDVYAYDPFTTQDHAGSLGVELMDLNELLSTVDYLSVHTPLTDKTSGLISLENAAQIKKGMRLVNCARGGIYNEKDLPKLIESGVIAGVALDVYTSEPPTPEIYKVLENPAVICTPHLGASTEEAQEKVAVQIAQQITDALENKNYKGSLNGKSISLLTNKEVKPYIELAEKLGKVTGQIMPDNTNSFSFEYTGDSSKYADILTDGILKGMLSEYVTESLNLINARHFAKERGMNIRETTSSNGKMYKDLVTIELGEDAPYKKLSAAVFGPNDYRIVEIDGYGIELRLEGDILMYQNQDKPGMLASVAGSLAAKNINIGALSLGRAGKGTNAITAVIVDKQLTKDEFKEICKLDGVQNVKYISLS